ncbi:MAG TPA: hypothetical protein VG144_07790 [Gaiellaceae bacterium]|jgi:hypothetical protein|nr:hypothetical protein [Gaiellaceae bacterium]
MTTRSCPDWPALLELAPDLHFKHYNAAEAQLPADALAALPDLALDSAELCADLDHNVFNPEHTDARIAEALRTTHWFDLREWVARGPRPV